MGQALEQLGKLFLMLSSTNDNEVVTAVRAIDRLLKKHNKDWHWVANKFGAQPATTAPTGSQRYGYTRPTEPPPQPEQDLTELFNKVLARRSRIGDGRTREFIDDMVQRFDKYGNRMHLSPKQREWLESIAYR